MTSKKDPASNERLAIPLSQGAQMIGIGLSYAYRLIELGQLQSFKIGRRRMVTREALASYVAAQVAEAGGRRRALKQ
ncbi:MAG: helix-turn-helix domain-containing protein, partial [Rhodanobacteraceae bacterium]|nr:helix-turn-helix domain-containing protein [Rhodanobacteraceae bacterium]